MICDIVVVVRRSLWMLSEKINSFLARKVRRRRVGDAKDINKKMKSCPFIYPKLERVVK